MHAPTEERDIFPLFVFFAMNLCVFACAWKQLLCDCLKGTTTQAQPHENGLRKATVGCLISSPAMQQDPVTWEAEADTARSVKGLLSEGELVPVTLQPSC